MFAKRETLDDLAESCHDVYVGHGNTRYNIPAIVQVRDHDLPMDRTSPVWEHWRQVAKKVSELSESAIVKQTTEQVAKVLQGNDMSPRMEGPTRRLAQFVVSRAQAILSEGPVQTA